MILLILTSFIFVGHYAYGVVDDCPLPASSFVLEDVWTQNVNEDSDVHFVFDEDMLVKVEFCHNLKMAEECFTSVEGLWDILFCKWEWESKLKALSKKVQKSRFAMLEKEIKEISNKFYKNIDICQKKIFPINASVSCTKSEVLKTGHYVFDIYECGTLLLRISRL